MSCTAMFRSSRRDSPIITPVNAFGLSEATVSSGSLSTDSIASAHSDPGPSVDR